MSPRRRPSVGTAALAVLLGLSGAGCDSSPTTPSSQPVLTGVYQYQAQFVGSTRPGLTGWLTLQDQSGARFAGALRLSGACGTEPDGRGIDCVLPLQGTQAADGTLQWVTMDSIAHTAVREGQDRLVGRWTLRLPFDTLTGERPTLRATFVAKRTDRIP